MSLLINLIPLEAGGGLQNACSFLLAAPLGRDCEVHARRLKSIQSALAKREIPLRAIPHGAMYRLRAEWGIARKGDGKQVCFTLFGPPPVFSKGRLINVVGCAYANLFYPELDFWSNHKGLARLKKTVIDWYRRWGIARADYWIFETDAIARRAIERFSFPPDRVFVVRMAPSRLVLESVTTRTFPELPPDRFLTLYLAGPHPNKRIGALIDVALALHARADTRFCFVLTLPPDAPQTRLLMERIARYGLERYFVNVGTVKPEHAGALIRRCHAMCNLARLESFSSNFVEAWAMRKPLLVTDADWSRASCADGAVYVHPERPQTIVAALQRLHEDKDFYASLVARGAGVLDTYPSAEQKAEHYLEIIRRRDLTSYRGPSVWRKRRRSHEVFRRGGVRVGHAAAVCAAALPPGQCAQERLPAAVRREHRPAGGVLSGRLDLHRPQSARRRSRGFRAGRAGDLRRRRAHRRPHADRVPLPDPVEQPRDPGGARPHLRGRPCPQAGGDRHGRVDRRELRDSPRRDHRGRRGGGRRQHRHQGCACL